VTRRSGLGRGLDALIPRSDADVAAQEAQSGGLLRVPTATVEPNPRQPRRSFDEESLAELAASIAELGMLQPVLVRALGEGRFELVAGERRLRAARAAGLESVPAVLTDTDARGALQRAIVENIHRQDLNPVEEAAAYRQLMDEGGLTQEELAVRVARSRATIANSLRLLDLPLGIQRLLAEGRLTSAHGKALAGLGGNPFQERVARRVAHEGLSVRATEELVRRYRAMSPRPGGGAPGEQPPELAEAQRVLADHLQTRARVDMGPRKGRIVLDFATLDELDRILKVILGETSGARRRTIRLE
jgi:ParB family chromosome partitioning protein